MKKSLLIGLACLVSAVVSFGQGTIKLDNGIGSAGPYVTFGNEGIPANGVSGASGTINNTIGGNGWTMGLYYALGDVTGSVASDPTKCADISTLGGNLILGR